MKTLFPLLSDTLPLLTTLVTNSSKKHAKPNTTYENDTVIDQFQIIITQTRFPGLVW